MDSFLIRGGRPLSGAIDVSGSKNSALPILAACVLADGVTTLHGVPRLSDIDSMTRLLEEIGFRVKRHEPAEPRSKHPVALNGPLEVEAVDDRPVEARYEIVKTMRASICVLGPMLAKRGRAKLSIPGGCAIGDRPVDLHLRGLRKLGATFREEGGYIHGEVPGGRLQGARMFLGGPQGPTVLGTINVMCAATLAEGTTTLVGAACEPEVTDCAEMLIAMGARIEGAGTPQVTIHGVKRLNGCTHRVIPDRIEAGTFIMAAAITRSDLLIRGCRDDHLLAVLDRLEDAGVVLEPGDGGLRVLGSQCRLREVEMVTQPYPGFPTDLQAQLMALLCFADGASVITERIFPERFTHIGELNRMGARIRKEGPSAFISGGRKLSGARVMCSDLRASAALVLAALAAEGTTVLDRVYHIDRGYEKIEHKLRAVGASIERVEEAEAISIAA